MTDLREVIKQKVLGEMVNCVNGAYSCLILDPHTVKIVNSACRVSDLNDRNVGVIQRIDWEREKLPTLHAIYFIEPTAMNVEAMRDDFTSKRESYKSAHVFFTSTCPPNVFGIIQDSDGLLNRLETLKEVHMDFLACEKRVFLLNRPSTLKTLFFSSTANANRNDELGFTADQIVSLCISLGEYPYIRYAEGTRDIAKRLATRVHEKMKKMLRELKNFEPCEQRATVLVLDRSMEPVTPLMHEFTYQAMMHDVLPMDGNKLKVRSRNPEGGLSEDTFELTENDDLYLQLRHEHIGIVRGEVTRLFNEFRSTNNMAGLRSRNARDASSAEMKDAIKDLPQYKKQAAEFYKHMSCVEACMSKYSDGLHDISELEQDLATGVTEEGEEVKTKKSQERLTSLTLSDDVRTLDKLRLVMIYIITQGGLKEDTRQKLLQKANFTREQKAAIMNLYTLGVTLASSSKKSKSKNFTKEQIKEAKKRAESVPLELMRFVPRLESVLRNQLRDDLNEDIFPYIGTAPPPRKQATRSAGKSARAARASRIRKSMRGSAAEESKEEAPNGPRLIVFMAGGITYSEIRSVYEITKEHNADVILGSTGTTNAELYIKHLGAGGVVDE